MMPERVEASVLRDIIRAKIRKTSLKDVAAELKIAPPALRDMLDNSREPGTRIAKALGYRRLAVQYERISQDTQ